jgi:predicted nucleic acid-binding protein
MSADAPRGEFVDTNVLLYAFDRSAGEKHQVASDLVSTPVEYSPVSAG